MYHWALCQNNLLLFQVLVIQQINCLVLIIIIYSIVIHVGAHCFNFENLVMSWSKSGDIDSKISQTDPWVNPVREKNSVSCSHLYKKCGGRVHTYRPPIKCFPHKIVTVHYTNYSPKASFCDVTPLMRENQPS